MPVLLLDTSVLVAAHNEDEGHHAAAKRLLEAIAADRWDAVLLHEYVFLELVTVLAARRSFQVAVRAGEALLTSSKVELVASSEDFSAVWETFRGQPRGKLSFADAALVSLARTRKATHIATFDKDLLRASGLQDASAR